MSAYPCSRRKRADGFTLVELMVTLSLVAVLMTVAVPSFQAFKRNSELTGAANTLVATLATARGEAMKRGRTVVVAPNNGVNWGNGWTVFVDRSSPSNEVYNAGTDELIASHTEPLPSYFSTARSDTLFLKYNGSGYALTSSNALVSNNSPSPTIEIARNDVSGTELLAHTRRIKIAFTGRVRVCTPKSALDADCSSPAS